MVSAVKQSDITYTL